MEPFEPSQPIVNLRTQNSFLLITVSTIFIPIKQPNLTSSIKPNSSRFQASKTLTTDAKSIAFFIGLELNTSSKLRWPSLRRSTKVVGKSMGKRGMGWARCVSFVPFFCSFLTHNAESLLVPPTLCFRLPAIFLRPTQLFANPSNAICHPF